MITYPIKVTWPVKVNIFGFRINRNVNFTFTEEDCLRFLTLLFGVDKAIKIMAFVQGITATL